MKPSATARRLALYILMFPQLIAGPIVRYDDIRDELHADGRETAPLGLGMRTSSSASARRC